MSVSDNAMRCKENADKGIRVSPLYAYYSGAGSADVWVDCLTEMERQGYNSSITIHVGPAPAN